MTEELKGKILKAFNEGMLVSSICSKFKISRDEMREFMHAQALTLHREGKAGPMKMTEKARIKKLIEDGWSDEKIALDTGRRLEAIRKFREQYKLKEVSKTDFEQSQEKVKFQIIKQLRDSTMWTQLKKKFLKHELSYFEESWAKFIMQFKEDVLPTEQEQIKDYITIMILLDRVVADAKKSQEDAERYSKEMDDIYKQPFEQRDMERLAQLTEVKTACDLANKSNMQQISSLMERSQQIQKSLKATRDQRFEKTQDGRTSWLNLLRYLEDEKNREREGKEAEITKAAMKNQFKILSQEHTYADGQVDLPFLTAELIEERNKEREDVYTEEL